MTNDKCTHCHRCPKGCDPCAHCGACSRCGMGAMPTVNPHPWQPLYVPPTHRPAADWGGMTTSPKQRYYIGDPPGSCGAGGSALAGQGWVQFASNDPNAACAAGLPFLGTSVWIGETRAAVVEVGRSRDVNGLGWTAYETTLS